MAIATSNEVNGSKPPTEEKAVEGEELTNPEGQEDRDIPSAKVEEEQK